MVRIFTKRKIIIYVLVIVVLVVGLLLIARFSGDDENLNPVQRVARQTLSIVSGVGAGFSNIFDFSTKNALQEELDATGAELAEVKTQLQLAESYAAENERLRELLGYKDSLATKWNTVAASVIGREVDNWYERLLINKGSDDGIKANMAVVNKDGLIGRTVNVTDTTAEVLLVIDAQGSLGGMLKESRTQGVLEGIGGGKGLLTMRNLPYAADIQLNAVVISAGTGGVFPSGLLVGKVIKVSTALDGLSKEAIVEPYCDFDHIEEVLILIGVPGEKDAAAEDNADGDTLADSDTPAEPTDEDVEAAG